MEYKFLLDDLMNLTDAKIVNPKCFKKTLNVSTDSREIKKGSIFVALKGENFDGSKFIDKAIELRQARKMSIGDAIVGATTLIHGFELVSRDVRGFSSLGIAVVNPIPS